MLPRGRWFAITACAVLVATPANSFTALLQQPGHVAAPLTRQFAKKAMKSQPRDPYANRGNKGNDKEPKLKKNSVNAPPSKGFGATKKKAPVGFEGTPIDDEGVAEFFAYLTANGADASKVLAVRTVETFYSARFSSRFGFE